LIISVVFVACFTLFLLAVRLLQAANDWGRRCAQEIWSKDLAHLSPREGIKRIDPNKRFLGIRAYTIHACTDGYTDEMIAILKEGIGEEEFWKYWRDYDPMSRQ
jgi:hypothetical protein